MILILFQINGINQINIKIKGGKDMQRTMKLISILLMVIMICFSFSTVVRATDGTSKVNDTIDIMQGSKANGTDGVAKIGGQIADILTTVGIVVAVIVILILGIKYMMGSASEKAEYKKTMIPYIVGAVLILGGSTIVKIVFGAFSF